MFAPPVAKEQRRRTETSTAIPALRRAKAASRPLDSGAGEQVQMPARTLEDIQAAWDFGGIPLFSPNGPRQVHPRSRPAGQQNNLVIGSSSDPLEHEADRVADQVMGMPTPALVATSAGPAQISRKCALCEAADEEKKKVQRKSTPSQAASVQAPAIVHDVLRSPGQPLDSATRAFFEPRFGRSLSHIRVHTDAEAAASARAIGARAYTRGPHIVFAGGSYQTETSSGRHLLAHELAHTEQQEHGASRLVQRAECSDYNNSTAAECKKHRCTTADGAQGICKKTSTTVCMCGPYKMWRMMPDWLLAVLGAAALAALVVCFATGVCEFAAVVAGLGAVAAAAVIAILKTAGIKDSGA